LYVPRNEDGELELILGNRQLLSVFFIMMILLGVFFTVGYIVGSNSGRVVAVDTGPVRAESKPMVVESAAPKQEPQIAVASPEPPPSKPVTTAPQQPPEPPAKSKTEPPAERPAPPAARGEPAQQAKAETAKAEPVRPEKLGGEPAPGQIFLQLSATQRAEAEVMVDVLRKKGFKATTSPVPDKPGLFRVLVGPLAEGSVGQTRAELQSAGFPGDKAIRKTF
jgi:hypothetical protein